jgi:electron transfer flavoprotein beta subunit
MKIGVCIKRVPGSDSRINVNDAATGPDLADVSWEVNPYDSFAIEAALQLQEAGIASDVVVFTVCGSDGDAKIRDALAMGKKGKCGASKAVRLDDPAFEGSDALGIARILAAAAAKEGVDVILAGKQSIDGDSSQVPAMMAEVLGWPSVCEVTDLEVAPGAVKAWRQAGGGKREVVELPTPCVITADKGLNTPRYPTLPGIMMAKRKPIEVLSAADIGIDPGTVGAAAANVSIGNWSPPPARPAGRMLEGETAEVVAELITLLRDEAKVI